MVDRLDESATRFIALISRRCGSTMLRQAIFQHHPQVVFLGEILNASLEEAPGAARWPAQRAILDDLFDGRFDRLPLVPEGELETIGGKDSIRAVGCKTGMIIGDDDAFLELIDRRHVRVIVITRANLLRLAISHLNGLRWAERTGGRWNLRPGEQVPWKLEVQEHELDAIIDHAVETDRKIDALVAGIRGPVLRLRYEGFQNTPQSAVDEILRFIGAPPAPVTPSFAKMTPENLRDIVANVGDLETYVSRRGWGEWLG